MHYAFSKILNKAVLTPQEYDDYFFEKKKQKKMPKKSKKPVGGVCSSQDWSQKILLTIRFFLEISLFDQTLRNSKKNGLQSEK